MLVVGSAWRGVACHVCRLSFVRLATRRESTNERRFLVCVRASVRTKEEKDGCRCRCVVHASSVKHASLKHVVPVLRRTQATYDTRYLYQQVGRLFGNDRSKHPSIHPTRTKTKKHACMHASSNDDGLLCSVPLCSRFLSKRKASWPHCRSERMDASSVTSRRVASRHHLSSISVAFHCIPFQTSCRSSLEALE